MYFLLSLILFLFPVLLALFMYNIFILVNKVKLIKMRNVS